MKFEIELTEKEARLVSEMDFGFTCNQTLRDQIKRQLPKEKKYKFRKGKFGKTNITEETADFGFSNYYTDGTVGYVFTREQLDLLLYELPVFTTPSDWRNERVTEEAKPTRKRFLDKYLASEVE